MNLDHIPVRLGKASTLKWREEILGFYRSVEGEGALEEEDLRRALELELDSKSVRAPLSRFLNGHGDEIRKWLCADGGEPNDKGRALARLCGQDIDALTALLGSLLPSRASAGLEMDDLRWLDFRIMKLEQKREKIEFEQGLMLRDWLEQERDGDVPVAVSSPRASRWIYDAPTDLEHELLELQHSHRPGVTITNRPATDDGIVVEVSPLDKETLLSWFMTLRELGKIDDLQRERLQEAFSGEGADLFYQLDASELLALVEAIMAGNITRMSPSATLRALIVQRKQRATRNRNAAFQVWANTSAAFFHRWFRVYTRTDIKVTNEDLEGFLELPPALELEPDSLNDLIDALSKHGEEHRQRAIEVIASRMPARNILYELKQGGVLIEDEHDPGWFTLSREWANIGALELIFELEPDDLSWLDVYWNYETIALAVRVAPPDRLNDWVDVILEDPSRISSGLEVLEGLTLRTDHADSLDDARLVRLWANLLWDALSEDSWQFVHVFDKASRLFEERLPLLDAESPLATLEEYADDEVTARYLDLQGLEASISDRFLGHRNLCNYVPFQLPFDFIKRVYPFRPAFDADSHTAPVIEIVRRWADIGNRDAREVLWEINDTRNALPKKELLAWIPALSFGESFDLQVSALDEVLTWAGEHLDEVEAGVYLSALRHVYDNFSKLLRRRFASDLPTLWSLHGLKLLGQLEPGFEVRTREGVVTAEDGSEVPKTITTEENPIARRLGGWLRPLLPEGEDELDLGPVEKTVEIARTLGLVDELERACSIHKQEIHFFFGLMGTARLDATGDEKSYHEARILNALHHEALAALWLLGRRAPLREFVDANERFQLVSHDLARDRLMAELVRCVRYRGDKIPANIDDDLWEVFVEWLFPSKMLVHYLHDHGLYQALRYFAPSEEVARKIMLPSPLLEIEPSGRRGVLVEALWNKIKRSTLLMPDAVFGFLIEAYEPNDYFNSEAISLWLEPKEEHEKLLLWAREHDDTILERWCGECLDPVSRGQGWWTLRTWALEDRPRRVERIWPHIEDEHRLQLLKDLKSPDDSQRIAKDSPLLEHLDLFEHAHEKLHFLRRHGIEGEHRARVTREYLYSGELPRLWSYLTLTDDERASVNHRYTERDADLEATSDALKTFLKTGKPREDEFHPAYLSDSTYVWCTDAITHRYPVLLESYVKYLTMRLCEQLTETSYSCYWPDDPDDFLYSRVERYIVSGLEHVELTRKSFDEPSLKALVLETIDHCIETVVIPEAVRPLLEDVPGIFIASLTGTWTRPEKMPEWRRTDIDEDTPVEVALRRLSHRFYESADEPVRYQDELEMLDFIEDVLEQIIAPHSRSNLLGILRSLRCAGSIERVRVIMQHLGDRATENQT